MTTKKNVEKKKEPVQLGSTRGSKNPFISTPDSLVKDSICTQILKIYKQSKKNKRFNSQREFGEYIGVPEPYIKGVLQKRFAPSHSVMAQISKVFGVTMDWLYGLEQSKVPLQK